MTHVDYSTPSIGYRVRLGAICAALLCALFSHGHALAAAFDCAKATTPREALICGDPTASKLDTQLNRIYREKLALLGAHAAEQLRHSELGWLRLINTACPLTGFNKFNPPSKCLKREYQNRLEQLLHIRKLGPFVFTHIDVFGATPAPDDTGSGSAPGFYVQHVGYPQIDDIRRPLTKDWNELAVRPFPVSGDCEAGPGDYEDNSYVTYANNTLISTSRNFGEYCHGAAHGIGWVEVKNLMLYRRVHELKPAELFGTDKRWDREVSGSGQAGATKAGLETATTWR